MQEVKPSTQSLLRSCKKLSGEASRKKIGLQAQVDLGHIKSHGPFQSLTPKTESLTSKFPSCVLFPGDGMFRRTHGLQKEELSSL